MNTYYKIKDSVFFSPQLSKVDINGFWGDFAMYPIEKLENDNLVGNFSNLIKVKTLAIARREGIVLDLSINSTQLWKRLESLINKAAELSLRNRRDL